MRIVGIAALLALALASNAAAKGTVLAELPNGGDIDALNGWIVWNEKVQDHWVLQAWHDGDVQQVSTRRPQVFDFDLGTDLKGRTVATYTRCQQYGGGQLDWWVSITSRGCSIKVLDLATGKERPAGEPVPKGMSHSTPSMWRGRIAYGEYEPYSGDGDALTQIRLWSPVTGRVLTKHHGVVPTCRYRPPCHPGSLPRVGWLVNMDLGDGLVAFTWGAQTTDEEKPTWEARAEDSHGHSRHLVWGGVGEGYGSMPWKPSVDGSRLWFGYSSVEDVVRHWLYTYRAGAKRAQQHHMDNHVISLARDHGTFYAVIRPNGASVYEPCSEDAPCTLSRLGPTVP